MVTYAIGDIHGRHDLLRQLLGRISEHAKHRPYRLVLLGDYIDRGPDSAAVVETIRRLQDAAPDRVVCLMGNHEAMLLTAMEDPAAIHWWIGNGGDATLESFGVESPLDMPGEVLDWFAGLPTSFEDERHYYVHAGFRPGRRPLEQTDEDRLWIREPFLTIDYDFGKYVVHGHTPCASGRPEIRPYRTNLDTAAFFAGVLTAGIFTDDQGPPVGFLRASG
jgi:serine/threonine protein phosphatase 1